MMRRAVWVVWLVVMLVACGQDKPTIRPTLTPIPTQAPLSPIAPTSTGHEGGRSEAIPTQAPSTSTPEEPLAARVNGEPVLLSTYERWLVLYPEVERDTVLADLIEATLVEQAANRLGVMPSEESIDEQVARDITAAGGEAAFAAWLQGTDQTTAGYRAWVRRALVYQAVFDRVTADVPERAEQVLMSHWVVDSLEEAATLRAQLEASDPGDEAAWVMAGTLPAELETIAFSLAAGEVSPAVPLGDEVHLIRVTDHQPDRLLSPEMKQAWQRTEFGRWLAGEQAGARIETFLDAP
jgi:parvulin-like peptidyl-prolyl isomerase